MTFPPEPWHLRGQLHLSAWLLPRSEVSSELPPGVKIWTVAGRVLVTCAFVVYEQGGILEYNELLSAVLVRKGWRPMATITDIWVDSAASKAGGRSIWGIPKELADFEYTVSPTRLRHRGSYPGIELAAAEFQSQRLLPGWWRRNWIGVVDLPVSWVG